MDIFFLLLGVAVVVAVVFVFRKSGNTLDVDGDGDVDADDVELAAEMVADAVEEIVVDLATMTKAQIEAWAKENLDLDLDRRKTKATLIAEVESQLQK